MIVMNYNRIFCRMASLFLGGFVFVSCVYDRIYEEEAREESPFTEGYSLNLMLTLDNMGGTRAETPNQLREFENYIDPEKCRVLFFDHEEKFLFESKSRWVKQLAPGGNGEQWMVSIPMYPYGNDVDERWEWDLIRKSLQEHSFKIAILANRPALELYPDLEKDPKYEDREEHNYKNFNNAGPFWTVKDTRGYVERTEGDEANIKTVFDLHHTQHDPIYNDKGKPTSNNVIWPGENFYAFVMGSDNGDLTMSSTSSWVDYGEAMDDEGEKEELTTSTSTSTSTRRYARRADISYPIPMYGIQEFDKIENWVEGVPFNLSNLTQGTEQQQGGYSYKSISLLRSVVKLEFVFPKKFANSNDDINIDILQLAYPNIYARSEPMDVWTPTDQLWTEGHKNEDGTINEECEWFTLKKYARLVEGGRSGAAATTGTLENEIYTDDKNYSDAGIGPTLTFKNRYNFNAYRRRLSWFYGAWLEKGWPFTGVNAYNNGSSSVKDADYVKQIVDERKNNGDEPPRIFNPCIQRNNRVMCYHRGTGKKDVRYSGFSDDATHHHFIVYMGERNSIDPNYIYQVDKTGGLAPTVCYWHIGIQHPTRPNDGSESQGTTYYAYSFPIADYQTGNPVLGINKGFYLDDKSGASNRYFTYRQGAEPKNSTAMQSYADAMVTEDTTDYLPWPLMRNHHYVIKVGAITRAAGADESGFGFAVRSEVNYSETLGAAAGVN